MMMVAARPRIEGDRESQVLEATIDLLIETGYHRLSMDAVAKQAKASKATLYRRWESKAALVIDALVKAKDMPNPELPNTGSLREDLIETFCGHDGLAAPRAALVMGAVMTATSTDPEFAALFREKFIGPKLAISRLIYAHAIERGEVPADIDVEIIAPALAAIVLHRSYLLGEAPSTEVITRVIDHVILPAATAGVPVR